MCGIAGFYDEKVKNFQKIKKFTNQLIHRGPDEEGFFSDYKGLSLGMRRLSIIDLKNGSQPIKTDKSVLIFNGEIFNFIELKNKYLKNIKNLNSDTKVLSYLYDKKGLSILKELNGFFSIVIYDKKKNKIILIRDRFGIKPLYYYLNKKSIYFCSEIDPLKNILHLHKDNLNINQVNNYFTLGYINGEDRVYQNIKMLNPGSLLEFNLKKKNIKYFKWFDIKKNKSVNFENKKDLIKILKEKLDNAVKLWTRSDVDQVFSLSGGLDSSLLAATYARQGKRLNTISFVYEPNKKFDMWNESLNSDLISKQLNSNHEKYFWSANDFKKDLHEIIESLEEPFGNSILPWFIYKKLKNRFKVCITGNGGDELFGNYLRVENYLSYKGIFYEKQNFKNNYFYKNYYFKREYQKKYLSRKNKDISNVFFKMLLEKKSNIDKKRNLALLDYVGQFKDDQLFSEDKLSMRNSIEVRAPYLDKDLFSFVYSLRNQRTKKDNYKYLVKELAKNVIPLGVLESQKKGFNMPISLFLRENFSSELRHYLSKKNLKKNGFINDIFYDDFVVPMLKGDNRYIQIVWNVLIFHIWNRIN
tara:strand:+ start:137 stop:1888 length:1752 start_codon:yes stop_codon:yes gene_type:complete